MKCIMLIAILVLLQILKFSDSQTIHVCTSTKGQQCHLDCETPDQSVSVTFTNPQPTAVGSCLASGTCGSGVPGYSVNQVNSTFTRLTIATLDYTRDYGNWSCSYGGTQSPLALLPCPSPSTTINITKEADNITCSSKCQFPVSAYSSLSLEYTQNGKVVSLVSGALPVSKNVTTDGCDSHETNVILQYQLTESEICGDVQFKCTFVNTYLGSNNGSLQHSFSGCTSSTVLSSTVHTSTPKPSPVCQPCLISDCLLLWQCIFIWIVIGVAVIILLSCCILCLCRKRQKSEKKQSIENNKMQNLKDKSRNNKAFDDETENKDRTDTKSIDKPGFDNSGYDNSGYNKSGYHKSGYDKSGSGYDKSGYDKSGYDEFGYDKSGYDKSGYDKFGYDKSGYDKSGYDKSGYDKFGYDKSGYDKFGYDKSGYDKSGYNKSGYDNSGNHKSGYDKSGNHKSGYDKSGNDKYGYDKSGNDKYGYDN